MFISLTLIYWTLQIVKIVKIVFRFGKRSEVEVDSAGPSSNDVIGPKDVEWLKYYLRSPIKRLINEKISRRQLEDIKHVKENVDSPSSELEQFSKSNF